MISIASSEDVFGIEGFTQSWGLDGHDGLDEAVYCLSIRANLLAWNKVVIAVT